MSQADRRGNASKTVRFEKDGEDDTRQTKGSAEKLCVSLCEIWLVMRKMQAGPLLSLSLCASTANPHPLEIWPTLLLQSLASSIGFVRR